MGNYSNSAFQDPEYFIFRGTTGSTSASKLQADIMSSSWFAFSSAASSVWSFRLVGLACCLVVLAVGLKKISHGHGIVAVAALWALLLSEYLTCEFLRAYTIRHQLRFAPFLTSEGLGARWVAGLDPGKYRPVVISDWPWSERVCPLDSGSVYGTLKNKRGQMLARASVCAGRVDVPTAAPFSTSDTDASGRFTFPCLPFGRYAVFPCNDMHQSIGATLGPAGRASTVGLRLVK